MPLNHSLGALVLLYNCLDEASNLLVSHEYPNNGCGYVHPSHNDHKTSDRPRAMHGDIVVLCHFYYHLILD